MKVRFTITVFLILSFSLAKGTQPPCCGMLNTTFETKKIAQINGSLDLTFVTKHNEGSFNVDSIWYSLPPGISFVNNSLDTGIYTGDSLQVDTLKITYDTSDLPYFLQELRMYMLTDSGLSMTPVYIYFTPWDTIEIWNDESNPIATRRWLVPNNLDTPQRVSIDLFFINLHLKPHSL